MFHTNVITHTFNGNIEDVPKFVEVEGKKYEDDGTGQPKKGSDGTLVPFVEKKQDVPPVFKVDEADLDALSKVNPHVARLLEEKQKREADDAKRSEDEKKKQDDEAVKKGEWQKLADERAVKIKESDEKIKTQNEQLGKYVKTVENILAVIQASIPKERQGLIPADFSARQKLEYIITNAEALGATTFGKGGNIPPTDAPPNGTDESKIVARIDELTKLGGTRTRAQDSEMFELAGKLKAIRLKK